MTNGSFYLSPYETVKETFDRLADGTNLGWPGSISIHGNIKPLNKNGRTQKQIETVPLVSRHCREIAKLLAKTSPQAAKEYVQGFYRRLAIDHKA